MGNDFTVTSYEQADGKCPTYDAFVEYEQASPELRAFVEAGVIRLQSWATHADSTNKLTEYVAHNLWCLRIAHGPTIARLFFTYLEGRHVLLLNGYVSQEEAIPRHHLDHADNLVKEVHSHAQ